MRIFNTIIHQLVQVMINMVSDEGAAKHTARRAACRQGRGLPDLCEVDWPILLCRRSGSIAALIELNSDNSHPVAPYRVSQRRKYPERSRPLLSKGGGTELCCKRVLPEAEAGETLAGEPWKPL